MTQATIVGLVEEYNEALAKRSYWNGSVFEPITKFSADEKGQFGEQLLHRLINECTGHDSQWDADANTDPGDGVYDVYYYTEEGKKVRIEVKTSQRTVSKGKPSGWQHENIYYTGRKWDKVAFIDYDTDGTIFFTIVDYDQLVVDEVIDLSLFGKNAHIRKNEEGKSKVDFSKKSIANGLNAGVTFCYNVNTPDDAALANFLNSKL